MKREEKMGVRRNYTYRRLGRLAMIIAVVLTIGACALFNQPPKPLITITSGSPYGPPPREITFDISGSSDPDGEIVSFTFDFADGTEPISGTDLTEPISHTYLETGVHLATLTVVDNSGEQTIAQIIVSVFATDE
jgi:PKD repeat protein